MDQTKGGKVSIRKRGQNYWEICVNLGVDPSTGKRVRSFHSFRGTKRQAEQEHTRLSRARDLGVYVPPAKMTLGEFLQRWLEDHARHQVSPRSLQGYRDIVRLHLEPCLGEIQLDKLRPIDIQTFYSDRLDRGRLKQPSADGEPTGLSPRTVLHIHRVLREALGEAVKMRMLAVNPTDAVTPPKVERGGNLKVLTENETAQLLDTVVGTPLHMPVLLAIGTGLRRGELLALRWADVNLETGEATVKRSLSETREGLSFKEPKSRESRRTVCLPAFVVKALKEHRKAQNEQRLMLGAGYQDNNLVLPSQDGSPWRPSTLTSAFSAMIRKHNLPLVRFHDLRHGHVTHLLLRGVPLKVVSARAGHSTIAITADLYGHLLPGADQQAAAHLDTAYNVPAGGSK